MHVSASSPELKDLDFLDSIIEFFELVKGGIPLFLNIEDEDDFTFGDIKANSQTLKEAIPSGSKTRYLVVVATSDDDEHMFAMGFSLNLGIVLASKMMLVPEATIKEKLDNDEFTEEDHETLFELGNIITGNADEFIHNQNGDFAAHLKIKELVFASDLQEDRYGISYATSLEIVKKYSGPVVVFMDSSLVEGVWGHSMDAPTEEEEGYEAPEVDESKSNVLLVQGEMDTEALDMETYIRDAYNVFRAPDIGLARDILSKERIEMVILDMDTESPGGISVTKWIKAITRSSRIPVVAFSNRPTKSMVISALKSGAVDFLVVPWDREKILSKLEVAIKAFGQKNVLV